MPKIIVSDPDGEREVALASDEIKIGRVSKGNDIAVKVPEASREHCRVYRQGSTWFVEDLGSSNGTRVNGRKVTTFELQDGDEIQVGVAKMRFLDSDVVAASAGSGGDDDEIELEISLDDEGYFRFLNTDRVDEKVTFSGRTTFGRKSTNTVKLTEKGVSGAHTEVVQEGGDWVVRDLGSTNGTIVDGEKVVESVLEPGTRVRVGTVEFVFGTGEDEGDGSAAATVMMADFPLGEEVFAISEGNLRRKQKTATVLWSVFFVAIVGSAYLWITQDVSREGKVVKVRPIPGNLVTVGASFEVSEELEDYLASASDSIDFEEVSRYRHTGQNSLLVEATGAGDHAVFFTREIENLSLTDHIELGGWFRTASLQGAAGLVLVWRDEDGRDIGSAYLNVPPGAADFTEVRGVFKAPYGTDRARVGFGFHDAQGKIWVDDVFALRLQRGEPNRNLDAHEFGVILAPSGALTVSRDGVEVLEDGGLYRVAGSFPEPCHPRFYAVGEERTADRLAVEGQLDAGGEAALTRATFSVERDETGVVFAGTVETGTGLALGFGVDPDEGLVTIADGGAVRHLEAFARDGVTEVVVGSGPRAVRMRLSEPSSVSMASRRGRNVVLLPLPGEGATKAFTVSLQLDFERERAEVAELDEAARRADLRDKSYGEAIRLYRDIFNRFPFRKDIADRARTRHDQLIDQGNRLAGDLEGRLESTLFYRTLDADHDSLREEAAAAAARYAGSAIAERVQGTVARLDAAYAERRTTRNAALAQNHLERGLDLMTPGRSAPELATGFFRSVLALAPEGEVADRARTELEKISTLTAEKR